MMNSEHSAENVIIATNVPILSADEWTDEQMEFQNKIVSYAVSLLAIISGGGVLYFFLLL